MGCRSRKTRAVTDDSSSMSMGASIPSSPTAAARTSRFSSRSATHSAARRAPSTSATSSRIRVVAFSIERKEARISEME